MTEPAAAPALLQSILLLKRGKYIHGGRYSLVGGVPSAEQRARCVGEGSDALAPFLNLPIIV